MIRLVLALTLVACSGARKECPAPVVPASAHGPAFLWRVQKGDGIVWLYGTIHDVGIDGVPPAALDALDHAPRLATELGDGNPDPESFRKHARFDKGRGIDQLLPADDWYDLRDALRVAKIKEDDLRRAKPWYAMSLLTTYSAPSPGVSMDVLLSKRAKDHGTPIEALETWDEQLDALERAVGVADLQEAIHARDAMRCDMSRLVASYRAGDTETMPALLVIPRTKDLLLDQRNKRWLPKIEGYVAQGGAFVAVGLGHLLGDDGLPALLARAGYTVERAPR